jgi:hypothetical protein
VGLATALIVSYRIAKPHKRLRHLLVGLLLVLTFIAIFPLVWNYSGLRRRENGFLEGILQVLVVTPEEVEIISFEDELEDYKKKHPDYSFLVPPGQETRINEQLVALYKKKFKERGIDAYPWVKVEQLGEGRQYLEVGLSGDPSELVVWYEATNKEIFPRFHRRFGAIPLVAMVIISGALTCLVWLGGFGLYKVYRRRSNPLSGLP